MPDLPPTLGNLIAALPWLLPLTLLPWLMARRPRLDGYPPAHGPDVPFVSVVVPARNEAENIGACVGTLLASEYPNFEVLIVDDGSVDGTSDIARILAARSEGRVRMVEGEALPAGWLGKSWACWQGYRQARGELLLFTDADTRHDDALLGHAVGALRTARASLLSLLARQRMDSFWERVILPQIFTLIRVRFLEAGRVNQARRARDILVNGQFLLVERSAYERAGGHEAVRGDVIEDIALGQRVFETGGTVHLAHAEELLETRMYRSLDQIVEGWTKNLAAGSRRSVPAVLAPLAPWILGVFTIGYWCVPPALLAASIVRFSVGTALGWAALATAASAAFWLAIHMRLKAPLLHAAFFPIGAFVTGLLFLSSAIRGSRIRWRGRSYPVPASTDP